MPPLEFFLFWNEDESLSVIDDESVLSSILNNLARLLVDIIPIKRYSLLGGREAGLRHLDNSHGLRRRGSCTLFLSVERGSQSPKREDNEEAKGLTIKRRHRERAPKLPLCNVSQWGCKCLLLVVGRNALFFCRLIMKFKIHIPSQHIEKSTLHLLKEIV
jgi:hypothetical protein